MRSLLAFLVLLTSGVLAAERPNVILILADDLGYGDLGCYGHPTFKTPHLDRMAAEGVRFTQFNCPAAFCAPTRAALMTGRYPSRCGMIGNPAPDAKPETDKIALPADEILLSQMFRKAGYRTDMIGKWHLGHHEGFLPTDRGFETYFGIPYSNDMRPVKLLRDTETAEYPVLQANLTRRYTDLACEIIERHQDEPFFLYLAHAMPHKPLAASEEWYQKTGNSLYGDVIAELDAGIGDLLAALKKHDLDEKTLVLFTSDNGPWFGGSSGGLRGMKGSTYEGGFRVPAIARWPGKIPAGQTSEALTVMMDFSATALAAAQIPPPADRVIDGVNLLPIMLDPANAPAPHDYIIGHKGAVPGSIRDARWKLHVLNPIDNFNRLPTDGSWVDPRAPDGVTIIAPYEQARPVEHPGLKTGAPSKPNQLFDLQADPAEQTDATHGHEAEVARLTQALADYEASLK